MPAHERAELERHAIARRELQIRDAALDLRGCARAVFAKALRVERREAHEGAARACGDLVGRIVRARRIPPRRTRRTARSVASRRDQRAWPASERCFARDSSRRSCSLRNSTQRSNGTEDDDRSDWARVADVSWRTTLLPAACSGMTSADDSARRPELSADQSHSAPLAHARSWAGSARIEQPLVRARRPSASGRLFSDLDLSEAKKSQFTSLQDCFTRELKDGARPIDDDPATLVSPCDAIVGACGTVDQGTVLQAKGFPYAADRSARRCRARAAYTKAAHTSRCESRRRCITASTRRTICEVEHVTYISGDTWNVYPIALKRVETPVLPERARHPALPADAFRHAHHCSCPWPRYSSPASDCTSPMCCCTSNIAGPNEIPCDARYAQGPGNGLVPARLDHHRVRPGGNVAARTACAKASGSGWGSRCSADTMIVPVSPGPRLHPWQRRTTNYSSVGLPRTQARRSDPTHLPASCAASAACRHGATESGLGQRIHSFLSVTVADSSALRAGLQAGMPPAFEDAARLTTRSTRSVTHVFEFGIQGPRESVQPCWPWRSHPPPWPRSSIRRAARTRPSTRCVTGTRSPSMRPVSITFPGCPAAARAPSNWAPAARRARWPSCTLRCSMRSMRSPATFRSYTGMARETRPASLDAAIATAARDTLVQLFREQAGAIQHPLQRGNSAYPSIPGTAEESWHRHRQPRRDAHSRHAHQRRFADTGAARRHRMDHQQPPGRWRQDPISQIPLALGAQWNNVRPFVMTSASQFRLPPPPALNSAAYTTAFNEVKRLGGDGINTPTERSQDQTNIGIYWAYDGVPTLCAPPRLYNQIATEISKNDHERHRSRAAVRARQHGHGRRRYRRLGVEVLLRLLASRRRHSRSRTRAPVPRARATAIPRRLVTRLLRRSARRLPT